MSTTLKRKYIVEFDLVPNNPLDTVVRGMVVTIAVDAVGVGEAIVLSNVELQKQGLKVSNTFVMLKMIDVTNPDANAVVYDINNRVIRLTYTLKYVDPNFDDDTKLLTETIRVSYRTSTVAMAKDNFIASSLKLTSDVIPFANKVKFVSAVDAVTGVTLESAPIVPPVSN